MKGLVFAEFLEIVEKNFSPEILERIIKASNLPSGGAYTSLGTYDHDEIIQLVTHLSAETDIPVADLVYIFGQHLFKQLITLHPWALEGIDSAFDFLSKVHDYIHVEVRKLYSDAELPQFEYDTSQPDQLVMDYRSSRPFAPLAHGMIAGCINYYGEDIDIRYEELDEDLTSSIRFVLTKRSNTKNNNATEQTNTHTLERRLNTTPEEAGPSIQDSSEEIKQLQQRIDRERQARKQAEMLAEEKTRELYLANEQITDLNYKLKAENLRMGAELEITRRLQEMVLPSDQELQQIPNLDIAGYMEPADEVGGDYYDVLQYQGRVKIGIGDVTGHGLESGVLMLMTQMGIRTLLMNEETDQTRFLRTLNHAIYENIERMQVDKSLTLVLLDYYDGQLTVSGQHEEIIVARRGGRVTLVDTLDLGFPIGLEEDIADFVSQTKVDLEPGDGVVLYTDGITEAENVKGEFYGLERLCEVIGQNWASSAESIKQAIIDDVHQHIGQQQILDDITLLILKQKDPSDREKML